jgi:hypothetical protein
MKLFASFFLIFIYGLNLYSLDWESKGREMIGEVVSNPAAFFYDFQQDLEATSPIISGKTFSLQTGLFPTLLPMSYANISGKLNLYSENSIAAGSPQFDLIGGYQNMVLASVAANQSNKINDASFSGYYGGFILSSSMSPKIRAFYGYKHSALRAKLNFNDGDEPELLKIKINSFDSGFRDDFIILGIETLKAVNKYWSIQLNYGFSTKNVSAKVSWYGKWFELGLNIYPEGVLTVHPVWNFHLNF